MNRARVSFLVLLLLASAVCASAQTLKKKKLVLSVSDKKEIVKQVFEDGFEKLFDSPAFSQCLTPIVGDKKVIFVFTYSVKSLLSGVFREFRLMVMSRTQIDDEVKRNNGECYFKFDGFQIQNSTVSVSLTRIIDEIYRFENSSKYTRWISGESYHYKFKKAGGWRVLSISKGILSS